jgi:serine protease Do/serine protease DegQ
MSRARLQRYLGQVGICIFGLLVVSASDCLGGDLPRERMQGYSARNLAPLVKRVSSAIVTIRSWDIPAEQRDVDPSGGFPDPPRLRELRGAGSIVDAAAGLVVTANHLVANAMAVEVSLQDGRTLNAGLVARSDRDDVALLQVTASALHGPALEVAADIEVGEFVLALGDSLNLGPSVSFGIVSALHRSCPGIANDDLIQSDALVEAGSSGGALINLRGKLIGVIVARRGEGRSGFAFAVPADAIMRLLATARREPPSQ